LFPPHVAMVDKVGQYMKSPHKKQNK